MESDKPQELGTGTNLHVRSSSRDQVDDCLKDLEIQLERARALQVEFEAFAESARDCAFISLGLDNTVTGWSKGAELLLGYSPDEILGKPGSTFFTPEDVASGEPDSEAQTALSHGR